MRTIGVLLMLGMAAAVFDGCSSRRGEAASAAIQDPDASRFAKATFAGGCFWCMEPPFDRQEGVFATTSGYTGGTVPNPSYEQVSRGGTGHIEAVQILYDPEKVTYQQLLAVFWREIDPFDGGGQFCDRGPQYRPAIFVHGAEQRKTAEASKAEIERQLGQSVAVEIVEAAPYYAAEEYHQDYYVKNPLRYKFYRKGCGRDRRLQQVWGATR